MEDKTLKDSYTCPECGCTVYVIEDFDFASCRFMYRHACCNCNYTKYTDGDSGQYPCEDSDYMDYKAEYEKLREKNKELEHQIEIYIKVLEEKEENCKRCVRPDYKTECEKLREECESLRRQKADLKRKNEHHCRALMLIRDLIDIV